MIFRLVLGSAKRLFGEGMPARAMRMIERELTPGGLIIASYHPPELFRQGASPPPETRVVEKEPKATGQRCLVIRS